MYASMFDTSTRCQVWTAVNLLTEGPRRHWITWKTSASSGFAGSMDNYLERTNIRINLVTITYPCPRCCDRVNTFSRCTHLAAQRDNRLNQDISNLTTEIALQTQRGSASMSTLAGVTVAFLLGTFVCVCHVMNPSRRSPFLLERGQRHTALLRSLSTMRQRKSN